MPIDLRSDTVTQPTPEMLAAMARAEVGDDVLEGDPTVRKLESQVAALLGKDAALFVPSGTMANLLALLSQTRAGDEFICDDGSHVYYYEGGGYAALAGVSVKFAHGENGLFTGDQLASSLRAPDAHFPTTTLVAVENTHNRAGGVPWTLPQLQGVSRAARARGLRLHMDGARLWNATAATGISEAAYAAEVDTVSVCFSKGLGCPVGSALVGDAPTIALARRKRKMLGGGMRQSGSLAAAAIYALDHNRSRISQDHARAKRLAEILAASPHLTVDPTRIHTNMVYFTVANSAGPAKSLCDRVESTVRMFATGPQTIRAVLHLHVTDKDVETAGKAIVAAAG
jgi:threonine aldolase